MNKNKMYFIFKNKFLQFHPDFIKSEKIRNTELLCYSLIDDARLKDIKKIVASKINITRELGTLHLLMDDSVIKMVYDRLYSGDK